MFLSLDESTNNDINILGGILCPLSLVPKYEEQFTKLRIEEKIFGEVKWSSIDQYYEKYKKFLNIFLKDEKSSYHSICYRDASKKYHVAYTLIRTVTWKIENYCKQVGNNMLKDEPFYILFDNNEGYGRIGTEEIRDINPRDPSFKIPLAFCNQGASHVLGALQLSDLITGAVANSVNSLPTNENQKSIIDHIVEHNNGIPLNFSPDRLPGLYEYKIQMFDPDDR